MFGVGLINLRILVLKIPISVPNGRIKLGPLNDYRWEGSAFELKLCLVLISGTPSIFLVA